MKRLEEYVDDLFRRIRKTGETEDLKAEILSYMRAKRDDLMAQGLDEAKATARAMESLTSVEGLVDGSQLTDMDKFRAECAQTALLGCTVFWILSLPLLFTRFASVSYLALALTAASLAAYFKLRSRRSCEAAFLSVTDCERRVKTVWRVWGVFFAVCAAALLGVMFGRDIWYGRALSIDGPYQLANAAANVYVSLLTILIPITFAGFPRLMTKCRKGEG